MAKNAKDEDVLLFCGETMKSSVNPGHTHSCIGKHSVGQRDHFCGECKRWWGRRESR